MRKIDSSVSTKRNVRDNVEGNFDDLMIQELLLSAQWVIIKLMSPHTWSMRELFFMVVMVFVT